MDNNQHISEIRNMTLLAFCINLFLTIIKFTVGIIGHSQAVVADACHTLSDLSTDLLIIFGVKFWTNPPDENHPYGHLRIESVITTMIGVVLACIGIRIAFKAIVTIGDDNILPTWIATIGPILTIVIKSWLYKVYILFGRKIKSSAVIANARHQLSDVLSSIPALIGSLGPVIFPNLVILDHLGALVVAFFLLQFSWSIIVPQLLELTDIGVSKENRHKIFDIVKSVKDVHLVQNFRSRKIGNGYFLDLTLLINEKLSVGEGDDIAEQVKNLLTKQGPDIVDVMVQIKPYSAETIINKVHQKFFSSVLKSQNEFE